MKLLLREYLASLKEREELDAILPDLLSELGFHVFSRPMRGPSQLGVDIAAIGQDDDGTKKVFLFSVKKGDLTRQDWDGSPQAMRPSLNEILDAYIPNRLPARYRQLPIVICLAFGGDVREQVRDKLSGFENQNETDRISFDEWNGDKIAEMVLKGVLRERFLPKDIRGSFQKAVAMVDEPEISCKHFDAVARQLLKIGSTTPRARLRAARQLNICLWVLFVWGRDAENLEASYRASEQVLLTCWELIRPVMNEKNRHSKALVHSMTQLMQLHITIATEFIDGKVIPWVDVEHGLSMAVKTQNSLDVNLAMFELLGRFGMTGLWVHWTASISSGDLREEAIKGARKVAQAGKELIRNNPTLMSPRADYQASDIALFLMLLAATGEGGDLIADWLEEMAGRVAFTVRTKQRYPGCHTNYRDLIRLDSAHTDDEFKAATVASTLIPLVTAWLVALNCEDSVKMLSELVTDQLTHTTMQLWTPDETSNDKWHAGKYGHGRAIARLPIDLDGKSLVALLNEHCRVNEEFQSLELVRIGWWPVMLIACRHFKLPVPPQLWVEMLLPAPMPAKS